MGALVTGVRATTLTPFHYHSLAIQDGSSTLAEYIGDVAMSFAIANVLGCLHGGPALPCKKDVKSHLESMPIQASLFETTSPKLMKPLLRRRNLEHEGLWTGSIHSATSTGNYATFYMAQEVPADVTYEGAFFGVDPFHVLSEAAGEKITEIVIRIGRNLSGLVKLVKAPDVKKVRLNAHTAILFDKENELKKKIVRYALHNIQPTETVELNEAKEIINSWRDF